MELTLQLGRIKSMKRQVNEEKTITQNFYFLKIKNIREGEQKKVIMDDNDT